MREEDKLTKQESEFFNKLYKKLLTTINEELMNCNYLNEKELTVAAWTALSNLVANFIITFNKGKDHDDLVKLFNDQLKFLIDVKKYKLFGGK